MGQFVAVSTSDPVLTQRLLSDCVAITHQLFGQCNKTQALSETLGIAGFGRQQKTDQSGVLVRLPQTQAWCLGVGTWIDQRPDAPLSPALRLAAAAQQQYAAFTAELEGIAGSFCFVTGASDDCAVQVTTDPVGQLHAYTLKMPGAVVISTSALLLAQIGDCGWDPIGVREFLATGTIYEQRSLFAGVEKIAPATTLEVRRGAIRHRRVYWSLADHVESDLSPAASLDRFEQAIESATTSVYRAFARPSQDLTGGFDSRILLASARKRSLTDRLHTVVAGPPDDPDVTAAAHIAATLGFDHQRIDAAPDSASRWWALAKAALPLVDGQYNMLEYARILGVQQRLACDYDVSINGSGGALMNGYWWNLLLPRVGARDRFDPVRFARARFAYDSWAEPIMAANFTDDLVAHFAGVIKRSSADLKGCRNTAYADNALLILRIHRWQGRIASATNRVWPCVSPFLFRAPLELALSAPVVLRRNGRMARQLLARMDPQLSRLPLAGGYPAAPMTLANLPDFAPLGREYLRRISKRVRRRRRPAVRPALDRLNAALFAQPEFAALFDPEQMLTASLYTNQHLRHLADNLDAHRLSIAHAGRMATLESVARLRMELPRR